MRSFPVKGNAAPIGFAVLLMQLHVIQAVETHPFHQYQYGIKDEIGHNELDDLQASMHPTVPPGLVSPNIGGMNRAKTPAGLIQCNWYRGGSVLEKFVGCQAGCIIVWQLNAGTYKSGPNHKLLKKGCAQEACVGDVHCWSEKSNTSTGDVFKHCCCNYDMCNGAEGISDYETSNYQADSPSGKEEDTGWFDILPGRKNSSSEGQEIGEVQQPVKDKGPYHCLHFARNSSDGLKGQSSDQARVNLTSLKYYPMGIRSDEVSMVLCESNCHTTWKVDSNNNSSIEIFTQGCWLGETSDCSAGDCLQRRENDEEPLHFCCCQGDKCNARFKSIYDPSETGTVTSVSTPRSSATVHAMDDWAKYSPIMLTLGVLIGGSMLTIIIVLVYRMCVAKRQWRRSRLTFNAPTLGGTHTTEFYLEGLNDSDLNSLTVYDMLVRGRYSEVRRGKLKDMEVAVKIYHQHHKQYYINEKTAFTLPYMEHENLVKFMGAYEWPETHGDGTCEDSQDTTQLMESCSKSFLLPGQCMVVTQLATHGSLSSYLKQNTLDWYTLCHMMLGICRGLVHLHTDVTRAGKWKPAIAHRDVNTRNILVKSDLTCVIADLGFSIGVMGSKIIRNGVVEIAEQAALADVGTLRYMAPEVLDGAVNLRDCEASLKQIDIYALGLVLWEVASRCVDLYQGAPVPEFQLSYQAEAGTHPLFEEMQVLVVKQKTRPRLPDVWKDSNPAVKFLKETMEDCWDSDAEARLTALCVQERIGDMGPLWQYGNKPRRPDHIIPTHINSELWIERMCTQRGVSAGVINANGFSVLPSFVDDDNGDSERQGKESELSRTGERVDEDDSYLRLFSSDQVEGKGENVSMLRTPLIGQKVSHVTQGKEDASKVAPWLQDQSLSESTVESFVTTTPLSTDGSNPDLAERHHQDSAVRVMSAHNQHHQNPHHGQQGGIKASNVALAQSHAVISRPSQGRNPTTERNTHKNSEEELAVSGNHLVDNSGDHRHSLPACGRPLSKCSNDGEVRADNLLNTGDAGDLASLVQSDRLNDTHRHQHHQVRNAPIPYLQNQVSAPHNYSGTINNVLARPLKLANMSNGDPTQDLEDYGHRRLELHTPQEGNDEKQRKSLKGMLGKFFLPKDPGHQIALPMTQKKNQPCRAKHMRQTVLDAELGGVSGGDVALVPSTLYINGGLELSPQRDENIDQPFALVSAPLSRLELGDLQSQSLPSNVYPATDSASVLLSEPYEGFDPYLGSTSLFVNQECCRAASVEPNVTSNDLGEARTQSLDLGKTGPDGNHPDIADMTCPDCMTDRGKFYPSQLLLAPEKNVSQSSPLPKADLGATANNNHTNYSNNNSNSNLISNGSNNSNSFNQQVYLTSTPPTQLSDMEREISKSENDPRVFNLSADSSSIVDGTVNLHLKPQDRHTGDLPPVVNPHWDSGQGTNQDLTDITETSTSEEEQNTKVIPALPTVSRNLTRKSEANHESHSSCPERTQDPGSSSLEVMSKSWTCTELEPQQAYPSAQLRPKSLSLKDGEVPAIPSKPMGCPNGRSRPPKVKARDGGRMSGSVSLTTMEAGQLKVMAGSEDARFREEITGKVSPSLQDGRVRRAGSDSSDSSEKIRRRIKTPVSFTSARLSLYDDRLMSQSLDPALLSGSDVFHV